ncbi:MAG: GIY-YIG nuclease family protein [Bacteroidota bacterium]
MFYTYILESKSVTSDFSRRFYYGHCEEINTRLKRHNSGRVSSTKAYRPWVVHYFERYTTKSEAYKREMFFKSSEGKKWLRAEQII